MKIEIGKTFYKYTMKNNKLYIHECPVICFRGRIVVQHEGTGCPYSIPDDDEIGVVLKDGISLWLTERNDELAKYIFIEHLQKRVISLQDQINRIKSTMLELSRKEES